MGNHWVNYMNIMGLKWLIIANICLGSSISINIIYITDFNVLIWGNHGVNYGTTGFFSYDDQWTTLDINGW